MALSSKVEHKESYITNCTFLIDLNNPTPLFSDNEKGELVVKLDKIWLIEEKYLTDELKQRLWDAVKVTQP